MKKTMMVSLALATLFASCNKSSDEQVSAKGYWKGQIFFYDVVLVNRDNGTAAFYVQVPDGDTAAAVQGRLDGTYTENGSFYRAVFPLYGTDTSYLELNQASPGQMKGYYFATSAPGVRMSVDIKR